MKCEKTPPGRDTSTIKEEQMTRALFGNHLLSFYTLICHLSDSRIILVKC